MGSLGRIALEAAYGARASAHKALAGIVMIATLAAAPLAAEEVTIAALGDSLTQGYGLPEEDGFVPQLTDWLAANGHGDVTVINAGVSGDTTAGGLARVAWTLTDEVDAVIVALGGNDLLRGIQPAVSRSNMEGIVAEISAAGLPVLVAGMEAPGNYGPDFKAEFDAIYPDVAETSGALLYPSFLGGLGARDLDEARALMQPDGIHPNAEGVARIVADMGPLVSELIARATTD